MKYDAFISYRHGELDGLVAEKLHKMLETYRIPASLAKKIGKKKLTRVFRDREELPTSSNLSDSINDALENSSYLLLICSRRTCQSQWVMREVERFGELHGKDRIVTLLIEGEPDESFPPGLRERKVGDEIIFVEPLAADIRAETWAGSLKLLKEEKLRLLAPVLGCAFDDLKQRHRRRKVQRIAVSAAAVLAFALAFGGFSTYQYIQINKQMQLKLQNQSYVLAEYATGALKDGDPDTAQLLAINALPADLEKPERPMVMAAEKALSDALGVYDVSGGFKPHKAITLPAAPSKVVLSPDERYAAALYPFEVAIFDTQSGTIVNKRATVQSVLADVEFLTDSVLVYSGEKGLECYDIAQNKVLWQGGEATAIAVSANKKTIVAVYEGNSVATLYSSEGKELGTLDFSGKTMRVPVEDSFLNPHDTLFALNETGSKLAVSFADGSLYLFDTATGAETNVYAASNAIYFAGGFYSDTLVYSAVEKEPYVSGLFVVNTLTNEKIAEYSSESSRFLPIAQQDGMYVAFDQQIMLLDPQTGELSHKASAGGRVESFNKSGDVYMMCESGGAYSFTGNGAKTYQSGYTCNFSDMGSRYALTGSYDSKVMRILENAHSSGSAVLSYDTEYEFSEAKITAHQNRAAFYSHKGMRLCDMNGAVVAQTDFPDPLSVTNTEYDAESGNIIVIYKNALRLYSGVDGALLLEAKGKAGAKSVIYTGFGVSVLDESGTATLYNTTTGKAVYQVKADKAADAALPIENGLLTVRDGHVFWQQQDLGAGELAGAGKTGENAYAFATSNGGGGTVFGVENGTLKELFSFEARGGAEAYFCGGYVFISPVYADAAAYKMDGSFVRSFAETGYMAEVGMLGDYITAGYVSAAQQRYTFLLDGSTLETKANLPRYCGKINDQTLVLNDGEGSLRSVMLYTTKELMDMAKEQLAGKTLTPEEIKYYKAG